MNYEFPKVNTLLSPQLRKQKPLKGPEQSPEINSEKTDDLITKSNRSGRWDYQHDSMGNLKTYKYNDPKHNGYGLGGFFKKPLI